MLPTPKRKRKLFSIAFVAAALLAIIAGRFVDFSWQGHLEGFYLLKGDANKSLKVTDDVYLGEEGALIAGVNFEWFHDLLQNHGASDAPHLEVEWSDGEGEGYVRNYLGAGKVLMTSFSRYDDSDQKKTHGLFVGGALPEALLDANENNTGMSYFDGQRWSHIWCNTNEGIGSTVTPYRVAPSDWRFLGSRIVSQSSEQVILSSRHEIVLDGIPLQMERTVEMTAGDPQLRLTVQITNSGNGVGRYFYYYGDEPWIGDFGSASGDVGWVDGRLVEYEEKIDPKTVAYAGMADYGSSVLGEGHNFGHVANFIAWLGPDKPDVVFFANRAEGYNHTDAVRVPLSGDGRSIGMYWGPRTLAAGQNQIFSLAIGMAAKDAVTGMPKRPMIVPFAHLPSPARESGQKSG